MKFSNYLNEESKLKDVEITYDDGTTTTISDVGTEQDIKRKYPIGMLVCCEHHMIQQKQSKLKK